MHKPLRDMKTVRDRILDSVARPDEATVAAALDAAQLVVDQLRDERNRARKMHRRAAAERDRLAEQVEQQRKRLVAVESDLLDVRGILSPNGAERRVPMPLVPTVAPAVEWLAATVDRVRELCARGPGPSNEYQIWTVDVLAALDREPDGHDDDQDDDERQVLADDCGHARPDPDSPAYRDWRHAHPFSYGKRVCMVSDPDTTGEVDGDGA